MNIGCLWPGRKPKAFAGTCRVRRSVPRREPNAKPARRRAAQRSRTARRSWCCRSRRTWPACRAAGSRSASDPGWRRGSRRRRWRWPGPVPRPRGWTPAGCPRHAGSPPARSPSAPRMAALAAPSATLIADCWLPSDWRIFARFSWSACFCSASASRIFGGGVISTISMRAMRMPHLSVTASICCCTSVLMRSRSDSASSSDSVPMTERSAVRASASMAMSKLATLNSACLASTIWVKIVALTVTTTLSLVITSWRSPGTGISRMSTRCSESMNGAMITRPGLVGLAVLAEPLDDADLALLHDVDHLSQHEEQDQDDETGDDQRADRAATQRDHVSSQCSSAVLTVRVVPTTFVTITAVEGGIKDPSAVTASQVSPSNRTWPLASSLHLIDRQSSCADEAAVHSADRRAGTAPGKRLADLWSHERNADRGHADGHAGLNEHMRRGGDGDRRRSSRAGRAEHGEERQVMQLDPDEHHTQHDPHEGHNSHLRRNHTQRVSTIARQPTTIATSCSATPSRRGRDRRRERPRAGRARPASGWPRRGCRRVARSRCHRARPSLRRAGC